MGCYWSSFWLMVSCLRNFGAVPDARFSCFVLVVDSFFFVGERGKRQVPESTDPHPYTGPCCLDHIPKPCDTTVPTWVTPEGRIHGGDTCESRSGHAVGCVGPSITPMG